MAPRAVTMPNYGLYYDRPPISIPPRGLKDGYNFRVKNGALSNLNLGWERFYPAGVGLHGRVQEFANFSPREQAEHLVFFTQTDIYRHDSVTNRPVFLTPQYDTGTAAASGTTVTGTSTLWAANAKAGDFIHFGDANYAGWDPDDWFEIDSVTDNDTLVLVDDAGTVADGPYTIRQTFIGNSNNLWSVAIFVEDEDSGDDLMIATNGVDDIISWNGTDATVTLHPELQFVAEAVVVFANMMIYVNVTTGGVTYPTSIINSDIGKPLAAGATGTGLSEQFRVTDRQEPLILGKVLGNNLVLYSRRQLIVAQFLGDPLIFAFRVAASDLGPMGLRGVADFGDYHEFLGADGQYNFDGVSVREINQHVGREIVRTADPLRRLFVYAHFDEENGDLIWSVPQNTDAGSGDLDSAPASAWSEHYLEVMPVGVGRAFSRRAWPFTASGYYSRATGLIWSEATETWADYNYAWNDQFLSLAFPLNLVGDENGDIFIANQTQSGDGAALPSYVRTARVPLSDGKQRALLSRIYPFTAQLNYTLDITTWLADFATSTALDGGTLEYDTSHVEGQFFVTPYRRARFVELQFGSDGTPWTLEGWDYEVKSGGRR